MNNQDKIRLDDADVRSLQPRGLGKLLDETFSIYSRHFKWFVALAAAIQIPVGIFTLFMFFFASKWFIVSLFTNLISTSGTMLVYSAAIHAVGEQYLTGKIDIGMCYKRAWHKIISIFAIAILFMSMMYALLWSIAINNVYINVVGFAMIVPCVALLIFWSLAIQVIVVENYKPIGAIKRSFELVYRSWWRLFGISLVFSLVVLGLAIIITIPFAMANGIFQLGPSTLGSTMQIATSMAVTTLAPPVLFIANTLLYYDIRVRKEHFDLKQLSNDMGLATAS